MLPQTETPVPNQPEQVAQPDISASSLPSNPPVTVLPSAAEPVTNKKPRTKLFIVLAVVLFLFLLAGGSVFSYLVAVEKVSIPNQGLTTAISSAVFSLPFVPKTPKFILQQALGTKSDLLVSSFDLSLAFRSDTLISGFGLNNFDANLKGFVDFSDSANPKFSLTADITKDFSAQIRKKDQFLYFKIDKFPVFLSSFISTDSAKLNSLFADWISYDVSPMTTAARENLNNQTPASPPEKLIDQFLTTLKTSGVLTHIVVTGENLDGNSVYKLRFAPDDQTLDEVFKKIYPVSNPANDLDVKLSDSYKNVVIQVWIDKINHHPVKMDVSYTMINSLYSPSDLLVSVTPNPLSAPKSPVDVSLVLSLSGFGQSKQIDIPERSIPVEELVNRFSDMTSSSNPAAFLTETPTSNAVRTQP
jgi:hypothetical protein